MLWVRAPGLPWGWRQRGETPGAEAASPPRAAWGSTRPAPLWGSGEAPVPERRMRPPRRAAAGARGQTRPPRCGMGRAVRGLGTLGAQDAGGGVRRVQICRLDRKMLGWILGSPPAKCWGAPWAQFPEVLGCALGSAIPKCDSVAQIQHLHSKSLRCPLGLSPQDAALCPRPIPRRHCNASWAQPPLKDVVPQLQPPKMLQCPRLGPQKKGRRKATHKSHLFD